jgi:alkylated DNA repair dioxygenase AlkB
MPNLFMDLARDAATKAGYPSFVPDACLINRYEPGARLTLHQDKNENDFGEPIVSVSLGIRNHRPRSRVTSNPLPAVRRDLYALQRLRHSNLVSGRLHADAGP